jgi:hypothetical protein
MKLAVYEESGVWFGWKEIFFEIESQSWDFGVPLMPTYKQVLRKEIISEEEAFDRKCTINTLLERISSNLK